MIKLIIRKIYAPFQIIIDAIRRQRGKRLMMSSAIKFKPIHPCALMKPPAQNVVKKIDLTFTVINGV